MDIGAYVIGSELLSGKRKDQHMGHCIEALGQRGLELSWCQVVGDSPELLTRLLRDSMKTDDVVFSFGGIGCTPDDHTRVCAAEAAGVTLVVPLPPLLPHPVISNRERHTTVVLMQCFTAVFLSRSW